MLFAESAIACLSEQLRRLVEAGHTLMVLDLRGVRSVSSDVLATLAGLHQRLERLGGRLRLRLPDTLLCDMLRICRLDQVFEIGPNHGEASSTDKLPAVRSRPHRPDDESS